MDGPRAESEARTVATTVPEPRAIVEWYMKLIYYRTRPKATITTRFYRQKVTEYTKKEIDGFQWIALNQIQRIHFINIFSAYNVGARATSNGCISFYRYVRAGENKCSGYCEQTLTYRRGEKK